MWWTSLALAQAPLLALTVRDPAGAVVLNETVALPYAATFPGEGHALGVYAATFDGTRGVLELTTGRLRDGRPKPKWRRSDELDPFVPFSATIRWKKVAWAADAVLGAVWAAPDAVDGACAVTEGPVLARTIRRSEGAGSLVVQAGTPVAPLDDGRVQITDGPLAFVLPVDPGDVGAPTEPLLRYPPDPVVHRTLAPGALGEAVGVAFASVGPQPVPVAGQAAVDAAVVTLQSACVRVTLPPAPQPPPPPKPPAWLR